MNVVRHWQFDVGAFLPIPQLHYSQKTWSWSRKILIADGILSRFPLKMNEVYLRIVSVLDHSYLRWSSCFNKYRKMQTFTLFLSHPIYSTHILQPKLGSLPAYACSLGWSKSLDLKRRSSISLCSPGFFVSQEHFSLWFTFD